MHEELANRLREEASSWCINCCYRAGDCLCAAPDDRKKDCDICSKLQAADVIEDLEFACNRYEKDYKDLCAYLPRWISVTERLLGPEWVLCKCRSNIYEVLSLRERYWYHDPRHKYMGGFVTHWMPLPEPPKEE